MIVRLEGVLEAVQEGVAHVTPPESGLMWEVHLPVYFAERLGERIGQRVTLHTLSYLEAQGQGSSFLPRVIGFPAPSDKRFFTLFTSVKGLGNRKALRALVNEPGLVAGAIAQRDTKALVALPEIGKRLAETIVAELHGKVNEFVEFDAEQRQEMPALTIEARQALEALVALGSTRGEAEQMIGAAMSKDESLDDADAILGAALAGIGR